MKNYGLTGFTVPLEVVVDGRDVLDGFVDVPVVEFIGLVVEEPVPTELGTLDPVVDGEFIPGVVDEPGVPDERGVVDDGKLGAVLDDGKVLPGVVDDG